MSYVVCMPRHKNRKQTVKDYFGRLIPHQYYKTKGYWESQTLVARNQLQTQEVVAIVVNGMLIKELLTKQQPHVIYLEDEWREYTGKMFESQGVVEALNQFNKDWDDQCLLEAWENGLTKTDKRLPTYLANNLKGSRNRQIFAACQQWFWQQESQQKQGQTA